MARSCFELSRLTQLTRIAIFGISLMLVSGVFSLLAAQEPAGPVASQPKPANPGGADAIGQKAAAQEAGGAEPAAPEAGRSGNKGDGTNSHQEQQAKQASGQEKPSDILSWLFEDEKDLRLKRPYYAALLLLLGAVGGMVTAFYSVGEALPGIGGSGLIEPEIARMQAFEDAVKVCAQNLGEIQAQLRSCDETRNDTACIDNLKYVATQYVEQMKLYESQVTRLRDLINANRWKIWSYGMPMYIFIGGATSLLFAKDWAQALLFGYSWSGVVSAIGLKGAASQKQAVIQDKAQELSNEIDRLKQKAADAEKEKMAALREKLALQKQLENASRLLEAAIKEP